MLSDTKKRQEYDQFGAAGSARAAGGQADRQYGWEYHSSRSAEQLFRDLFGDFEKAFGGQRARGPFAETAAGFEASQQVTLNISFEEAARGVKKTISVNVVDNCWKCKGSGVEPGYKKVRAILRTLGMFRKFRYLVPTATALA